MRRSTRRARSHCLTSKLYEYMASGAPVLIINPSKSDRLFLRKWRSVIQLSRPTERSVADALRQLLDRDADPLELDAFRSRYSRRSLTAALAAALDRVAAAEVSTRSTAFVYPTPRGSTG